LFEKSVLPWVGVMKKNIYIYIYIIFFLFLNFK
jgi:hypothetical protein